MRIFFIFQISLLFFSCGVKREGIPENERNYSELVITKSDSSCLSAPDALFSFYHINADTISNAIISANLKYFGKNFATSEINSDIRNWLVNDYFSIKTYTQKKWNLNCDLDVSKFSAGYRSLHSLEKHGIKLFFENSICFKKWIRQVGRYKYTEEINGNFYEYDMNRLRLLCEIRVNIRYAPNSIFKLKKHEYYRIIKTDTVDMFSSFDSSAYIKLLSK